MMAQSLTEKLKLEQQPSTTECGESQATRLQVIGSSILVINSGSSSIRFALYHFKQTPLVVLAGKIEHTDQKNYKLNVTVPLGSKTITLNGSDSVSAQLVTWLECQSIFLSVKAVGHRVVHGMKHSEVQLITPVLLDELKDIVAFAPQHLPQALELIELINLRHTELPQIACFDTAFHQSMPLVASQLPLPRSYQAEDLRRYGFHGLSCEYLMQSLKQLRDPAAINGRMILAHLGGGASLTAVKNGQSIDNSMGFTPTGGVMMATRSGDLDPGILTYLLRNRNLTVDQLDTLLNEQSGLLGVSQSSADIRDLLALEDEDARAAEAVNLFCYQICKWIGAFSAVLGGLDTLVFTGGIGENSAQIRERVCAELNFLGISLSSERNLNNLPLISADNSLVNVRVIATDEEIVIARSVASIIQEKH